MTQVDEVVSKMRTIAGHRRYILLGMAILALGLLIAGCGGSKKATTGGFSGSRSMTLSGCSETLTVRDDGTYTQNISNKAGRSTNNTNKWTYGEGIKGSNEPGPWLVLQGKMTPSDWCTAKPNTPVEHADSLISGIGFNGAKELAKARPKETFFGIDMTSKKTFRHSPAVIFLSIFGTLVWIFALVDSARKGKFGWLVVIALTGCCGTVCYFIFGMWSLPSYSHSPRGTPPGFGGL